MILRGIIRNLDPLVRATTRSGRLRLGSGGGFAIVIDTGFNGSVSLPRSLLRRLHLKKEGFEIFRLANGKRVRLPVFSGSVLLKGRLVPAWLVPGEALLGMEFLTSVGSSMTLDFRRGVVRIK